ncbi:DUF2911 domain-containing protein [Gramella sp. KN1008]|uniref:DUF2911 domain-containing protein n=1 Tax=Gramella sp. KN1008 TaxID=2529298 RepID=UPI0010392601|nr:DUF2911 domain-containing protein [Gramella sp. KN1008]TBW28084.1 DUF2911 domain-containing protein [Gramella sp. KN1008]
MKKIIITIVIAVISFSGFAQDHDHKGHSMTNKETTEGKKKSLSPHTSAMAMIGDAHVHIDYSSPRVRDRVIFGGLVGYDRVWQAGAHMATWIETNKDLVFDGKTLPAGKYAFFTIPGRETWKVMFNSNWDQHGKDEYDEKNDVLVLNVKPEQSQEIQEELEYKVDKIGGNKGMISLGWEKVKISLPFEVSP